MLFGFFTLLFVLPSFSVTVELFWPEHHYLRVCTWGDLHSRHKPNRSWAPSIYSTSKVQFLVPAVTRPRKCPTTDRVESSRSYRILKLNAAKSVFGLQHFFHSKQPHGRVHRPHGWTLTKCEWTERVARRRRDCSIQELTDDRFLSTKFHNHVFSIVQPHLLLYQQCWINHEASSGFALKALEPSHYEKPMYWVRISHNHTKPWFLIRMVAPNLQ